jgi:sugar O-acyltransferase (sialic acid O-acetyltransferase NeuD family)
MPRQQPWSFFVYTTRAQRFQFSICPAAALVQTARASGQAQAQGYIGRIAIRVNSHNRMDLALIFYGAGGHARVAIDAARAAGLKPALIIDDNPKTTELSGVPLELASTVNWTKLGPFRFVVTIGDNPTRARIFQDLLARGGTPQTIIHPFTSISPSARIGAGTVIFAGVVVNADSQIGQNCILNTNCNVDHDAQIAAHVHLCPSVGLAGNVTIGERTMLGTGAICIPGIKIGSDSKIGAGAVVLKHLPDHCKAFGNPARIYGQNDM